MTATFSNPRISTKPAERMQGDVIFAEDFVSTARVEANAGSLSGQNVSRGLFCVGGGSCTFPQVAIGSVFSVLVEFSSESLQDSTIVDNFKFSESRWGFSIRATADGISAGIDDGTSQSGDISVPLDYSDGKIHTLLYVVDQDTGEHHLRVDDLAVVTAITTVSGSLDLDEEIDFGFQLVGTVYMARVFESVISDATFELYRTSQITSFMADALATWRCDAVLDDDNGNKIWDKQPTLNDLYKADRVDSDAFPTFDGDKYFFDLVDDYVSNVPELPEEYTVSAVTSNQLAPLAAIRQENDTTLLDELSTPGTFWGNLHNMILHPGVLTSLQLSHSEYQQLYYIDRGYSRGMFSRLANEGTGRWTWMLSKSFTNWGTDRGVLIGRGVTLDDDGVTFPNPDSSLKQSASDAAGPVGGTLMVFGSFDAEDPAVSYLFDNDSGIELSTVGASIVFATRTIAHSFSNNKAIAVTWEWGLKPRIYIDGEFLGEGSGTVATGATTDEITIGNIASGGSPSKYKINHVYFGDKPLTDEEILAMYQQSLVLENEAMETGNRTESLSSFAGIAVDIDQAQNEAYQLIDVVFNFDVAPTTSELITVKTVRQSDSKETLEYSFDPSLSSETKHTFRFDKRFARLRDIAIDYANTDTNNVDVIITTQTDDSVN
jgi:hypothetical protein